MGEDSTIEFKAIIFHGQNIAETHQDKLANELAAIANSSDGVIVLGVDD